MAGAIGRIGLVVGERDNDVTRQPLFLRQLADSKAHVFVLLALNGASPEGKASCIVQA